MLLPDDYLRAVAAATHEHEGLFVLDSIASGALWVDMKDAGVDRSTWYYTMPGSQQG